MGRCGGSKRRKTRAECRTPQEEIDNLIPPWECSNEALALARAGTIESPEGWAAIVAIIEIYLDSQDRSLTEADKKERREVSLGRIEEVKAKVGGLMTEIDTWLAELNKRRGR